MDIIFLFSIQGPLSLGYLICDQGLKYHPCKDTSQSSTFRLDLCPECYRDMLNYLLDIYICFTGDLDDIVLLSLFRTEGLLEIILDLVC